MADSNPPPPPRYPPLLSCTPEIHCNIFQHMTNAEVVEIVAGVDKGYRYSMDPSITQANRELLHSCSAEMYKTNRLVKVVFKGDPQHRPWQFAPYMTNDVLALDSENASFATVNIQTQVPDDSTVEDDCLLTLKGFSTFLAALAAAHLRFCFSPPVQTGEVRYKYKVGIRRRHDNALHDQLWRDLVGVARYVEGAGEVFDFHFVEKVPALALDAGPLNSSRAERQIQLLRFEKERVEDLLEFDGGHTLEKLCPVKGPYAEVVDNAVALLERADVDNAVALLVGTADNGAATTSAQVVAYQADLKARRADIELICLTALHNALVVRARSYFQAEFDVFGAHRAYCSDRCPCPLLRTKLGLDILQQSGPQDAPEIPSLVWCALRRLVDLEHSGCKVATDDECAALVTAMQSSKRCVQQALPDSRYDVSALIDRDIDLIQQVQTMLVDPPTGEELSDIRYTAEEWAAVAEGQWYEQLRLLRLSPRQGPGGTSNFDIRVVVVPESDGTGGEPLREHHFCGALDHLPKLVRRRTALRADEPADSLKKVT